MQTVDIPPHNCIYVNNLSERLKKPELVQNLYYAFSQFGQILEVHAQRSRTLRGQAWILFEKIDSATQAVRGMNGFMFFGKPMRVTFSRNKADTMAKQDGDYKARAKRVTPPTKTEVSRAPVQNISKRRRSRSPEERKQSKAMDTSPERGEKKAEEAPNKILFVEHLPAACTAEMLTVLFAQYEGYVEARLIQGKPGIAFVEFSSAYHAEHAKDTLQGFKITGTNHMKITFARQ